jgi:hypothetical protein
MSINGPATRQALVPAHASAQAGTFKMTDLLRFAGVDPATRGQ